MLRALVAISLVTCACHDRPPPTDAPSLRVRTDVTLIETPVAVVRGPRLALRSPTAYADVHELVWEGDDLWAATSGGVLRFSRAADEAPPPPQRIGPVDGLPSPEVTRLVPIARELWAATDRGAARIEVDSARVLAVALAGERVLAVIAPSWALTRRGVVRLRDGGLLIARADVHDAVWCGGSLYLAPELGVEVVEGTPGAGRATRVRGLPAVAVTALACDAGTVFAQTALGDWALAPEPHRVPGRPPLRAVADDRIAEIVERQLCVSVAGTRRCRELPGPKGLVSAIATRGDALWVGTFDDGLYRVEGDRWRRLSMPDPRISALLASSTGLLVGTATGLRVVEGDRSQAVADPRRWLERYISSLRALDDRVLVGVYPGTVELDGSLRPGSRRSGKLDEPGTRGAAPLLGTAVNGGAQVGDRLWLATLEGLAAVDERGSEVYASVGSALPDDWVNDVVAFEGRPYFLLGDRGLGRVERDGELRVWSAPLPSVSGSLHRLGALLVFVADGALYAARPEPSGALSLVRFGASEGLPLSASALHYDAPADRLWVGGIGGVAGADAASQALAAAVELVAPASAHPLEVPR